MPGIYSGTSDKGPSEIGTTSLQRTLVAAPCKYFSVLFYLRDRDNLSTRDKTISPKVSLVRRFHCNVYMYGAIYPRMYGAMIYTVTLA